MEQPLPPPRVAVVIVARFQKHALEKCLTELGPARGVIVIENGSSDTLELQERFPNVRYIRIPRDFGFTKALNIGIRAVEAELVLFLSPEVAITESAIQLLADTLDAENATGAVAAWLVAGDAPAPQVSQLPTPKAPDPALEPGAPGQRPNRITLEATMFRMFLLRALRHVDERYGDYGSDIELSQQVARAGKTILIHPEARAQITQEPEPGSNLIESDRVMGTYGYLGKYYGFMTGLTYWLGRTLGALVTFRIGLFLNLVQFKKIDGK